MSQLREQQPAQRRRAARRRCREMAWRCVAQQAQPVLQGSGLALRCSAGVARVEGQRPVGEADGIGQTAVKDGCVCGLSETAAPDGYLALTSGGPGLVLARPSSSSQWGPWSVQNTMQCIYSRMGDS